MQMYYSLLSNLRKIKLNIITGCILLSLCVTGFVESGINNTYAAETKEGVSEAVENTAEAEAGSSEAGKTTAEAEEGTPEADNSTENVSGGAAAVTNQISGVGYATKLYDATNGLPTSDANTILSTSDGFIWIGGYSGLIRYDGTTFERQDSSGGITNANALFEDSQNRLWVGTNDNGVVVTDKDYSRHYTYLDGLRTSSIRSITEDGSSNIIIGTNTGISYVDANGDLYNLDDNRLNDAYITRLVRDSAGDVYGNTVDGSCFRIRDLKVISYYTSDQLGIGEISTICADPNEDGAVWFGTDTGLVAKGSFDKDLKKIHTIARPEAEDANQGVATTVNCIDFAGSRTWILTGDSIFWLDESNQPVKLDNIPLNSAISAMTEDYEGNLWFSSYRQGVMKIVANRFTDITERAGLEHTVVNATCVFDNNLYIGTDTGLSIVKHGYRQVNNDLTDYIGDSRVRYLMEDNDHNLWISTFSFDRGLVCYTQDGEIKAYTVDTGMPSNEVRGTSLASDGSVIAATNNGMAIIKNDKVKKVIGQGYPGVSDTVFLSAIEGDDGKYYIGTDGDGLYIADKDGVTRLGRDDGLLSDVIMRVKKDEKRGIYWIITSNSIAWMKDEVITTVDKFPYSNNYDIYFDKNDNAWILASNGIYVTQADNLLGEEEFDWLFYDLSSGLYSMPTGNAISALEEDGMLYVSGRSGVYSVNIDDYFEQTHDIRLLVTYIESDGKRYYPDADNIISLPASVNAITIYGHALTYTMQNPEISYQLEGVDMQPELEFKEEMEPIRYTNIKGGKYTYRLSVLNTSDNTIQQTTRVTIIKAKAYYETIWFGMLVTLCALLIIAFFAWLYIRHQTEKLVKKEEENREFIHEMAQAFAKIIDMKDKYTNGHSTRVAEYTAMLTRELGYDEETVEKYYHIALLHDIGKIGVPPEVLNKPGKLTDKEFAIIKSHSALGYNALKDISIMPELAIGAGAHHERPDGKGYPKGLKGDEIPRVAQIIAVADTFDAMYSDRPYRKRMNFEKVVSIMKEVSGTQLTTDVVDAFLSLVEKGQFKAPDDMGGGSIEDIDNIHRKFENESGGDVEK